MTTRDLANLAHYLSTENVKPTVMQSGIKFRSICAECNNSLLGSGYDPHLNALSQEAANLLRASKYLSLPGKHLVKARPQRIARAVVGHLLAAEIRDDMTDLPIRAPFQDALRSYLLDPNAHLPASIDIRYWVYSGDAHLIIHGCGIGSIKRKGCVVCDILKYFPLAFLVVFDPPEHTAMKAHSLVRDRGQNLDEEAELVLQLAPRPRTGWPEQPDDDEYVLFNDSAAYIAHVRRKAQATR